SPGPRPARGVSAGSWTPAPGIPASSPGPDAGAILHARSARPRTKSSGQMPPAPDRVAGTHGRTHREPRSGSRSGELRYFLARTVCAIIVPLPTSAVADAVPVSTLVELEIRAWSDSTCVPTGTLLATKLNDAAFSVERINSISSGVTQVWSTMMLVVPSAFVTVERQPPIAPSSVAESVCVLAAYVTTPGGTSVLSIFARTW